MVDSIVDAIMDAIARLFFHVEALMAQFLDLLYEVFEKYAGIEPVRNKGTETYLIDIFFNNDIVTTLYWGMAVIGIALTFGFAMFSVIKKLFDSTGEKVKATNGQILLNVFKSILLILLMTALVSAVITSTGILMQQVDYLFDNAAEINNPSTIEFDDEDYATMFRVIDTIGNYSLNSSFNNRVNINSCFNSIRGDLYVLYRNRVFEYDYSVTAESKASWQYALRQIYLAADVTQDLPLDKYNEAVTKAITDVVNRIHTDSRFIPLSSYYRGYTMSIDGSVIGRTVLLASSFNAAKNNYYNEHASIDDSIRSPFYTKAKDIYNLDEVEEYFDIGFDSWDHIAAVFVIAILIMEFLKILINCVARIFNIILLYITAPGFISVLPLDDGGKLKQWCTAFVIQSLSIFGTVFAVRLLMVFLPIVLSSDLVIFEDTLKNIMAKEVIIMAVCMTAEKASGMISGILADNAGYQSIMAGDVGSGALSKGLSIAGGLAKGVLKAGKAVGGGALGMLSDATGLTTAANKVGGGLKNFGQALRDKGGIAGGIMKGFTTQAQDDQKKKDEKEDADRRDTNEFRNDMRSMLGAIAGNFPAPPPAENPVKPSSNSTGPASQPNMAIKSGGPDPAPVNNNPIPAANPVQDSMGPSGQPNMNNMDDIDVE